MRNFKPIYALLILLALPSLATAGTLESLTGVADCNSWTAELTIGFTANTMMTRVEYVVILQDARGVEIDRQEQVAMVATPTTPSAVFTYTGAWTTALTGDYTVTADFTVYDIFGDGYNMSTGSFTANPACGTGATDPVCLFPAQYWAQHPDEWPLQEMEINGHLYDQNDLLHMLDQRRHRLLGFRLIRQIIAARLNVAAGGSDEILPVIAEAESFLSRTAHRGRGRAKNRRRALWLKAALLHYNRSGCDGPGGPGVTISLSGRFDKNVDKSAVETMAFGTLKAMYQ